MPSWNQIPSKKVSTTVLGHHGPIKLKKSPVKTPLKSKLPELIDSWTTTFLLSPTSQLGSARRSEGLKKLALNRSSSAPALALPKALPRTPIGFRPSTPNASFQSNVFGMSSSSYKYSHRKDPELYAKAMSLAAARPRTANGGERDSTMSPGGTGSATHRPGTSDSPFRTTNKRHNKRQQQEMLERLAMQPINTQKFVKKEKDTYETKRGKQMINSKFDQKKMNAVRARQQQYSKQLDESAGDKISLQIDSVTRAVVQNFRKLINSERCALFLHDARTNELYFKPVAGHDTNVSEIRFPASAGIAGWVATSGKMLNIPNAYKDERFNSAIDKKTGFRTRSILCMPILNEDGSLLGVCQMLNKFKRKKIERAAVGTISRAMDGDGEVDKQFTPFNKDDEVTLKRCCEKVADALSHLRDLQKTAVEEEAMRKQAAMSRRKLMDEGVGGHGARTNPNSLHNTPHDVSRGLGLGLGTGAKTVPNTPGGVTRNLASAKQEVKGLISFMSGEVSKLESEFEDNTGFGGDAGISEAARRFQFRDGVSGQQMTSKGQTLDAEENRAALTKHKRQKAYVAQCQDFNMDESDVAMNSALRNMMAKFKIMLQCDRCGLFFLDDETDELYFHVEEEGSNIRFPKTKGIAGEALLIKDAYKDDRFNKTVDKMTGYKTNNILCQPVKDGLGEIIAVMQMVNSMKKGGFTAKDQESLKDYSQKMSQGLLAIRDSGKDGTSGHMQKSREAKIKRMNEVIHEINQQIDAEKKAFLAKRKEESRHEYTANEAAARFKFRDGGEKQKEEKVFNEEQIRAQNNQKLFDDIFSGKGIDIENTKEKKGEKGGESGGRSRRASVDLGGSIGGIRRTSVDLGGSIGGMGLGVGKGVLALPPGLEKGGRSRAGSGSGENSPSNRSRRSSISGSATPSHAAMMGRASANASAEATPKRMQQKNLTAYQIAVPAGTKSRMGSRRPSVA
ncbi:hypothetical protein TL16_g09572 [Triparma laevis f. inornata]|uniref:GAF domain-containing protein n=1 Tax=Triparma laevis f. inornata TaxID=1714386 RepID=A0A9W7BAQ3_9STRA|nr:hypothetical protein TL16_g09572 [Triparma laevis f. inornata]